MIDQIPYLECEIANSKKNRTVRGKKSRLPSLLAEATVESTFVSSIAKTTEPFANRAILPVSIVIFRVPISNSSVKVSRIFFPETAAASESEVDDSAADDGGAWAMRPPQMVRYLIRRHGMLDSKGFALVAIGAICVLGRKSEKLRF